MIRKTRTTKIIVAVKETKLMGDHMKNTGTIKEMEDKLLGNEQDIAIVAALEVTMVTQRASKDVIVLMTVIVMKMLQKRKHLVQKF